MSGDEAGRYTLEDLIRFGGDRANQDANAAELARLRRIVAAADDLAERVGEWAAIPFVPGQDDEYEAQSSAAEDYILDALAVYRAARRPDEDE